MRTSDFHFDLPEELIAQSPPEKRGDSRMLALQRSTGECELKKFSDFPSYLKQGDCLILNNTKVLNARIYGRKNAEAGSTGALIEILLLNPIGGSFQEWKAFLKPAKRVKENSVIHLVRNPEDKDFHEDSFTLLSKEDDGSVRLRFSSPDFDMLQEKYGHVPLPPYIRREDINEDKTRYQTVFASAPGPVAAPTAGLHFTQEVLNSIKAKGIETGELTLHVGAGTFKPVSVENLEEHKMHSEFYIMPERTAELINRTKRNGGRVIAVGTTAVRTIESCANEDGSVRAGSGSTEIFMYPPAKPKTVDMLLTNFHLPESTLIMLICCFAEREKVLAAYKLAVEEKFRFFSYGDCMLLH